MQKLLAPICLFTYNRLFETQQTIKALKNNYLAKESELFIFSDGPRNEISKSAIEDVRKYIHSITGFKSVKIIESQVNNGLANSIIGGVTMVIKKYGKVIVLEDDLISSQNFLDFMNQSLDFYQDKSKVLSISGYSFSIKYQNDYNFDMTFGYRASSWGWATWVDRWKHIDWIINDYSNFKWNMVKRIKFNRGGSDMAHMLDNQMQGKINSWAIRFCYHQYKHNMLDVFPIKSKILNIGFSQNGSNCKFEGRRFKTSLDTSEKRSFNFNDSLEVNKEIMREFYVHYSFRSRLYDKIKYLLWKIKN